MYLNLNARTSAYLVQNHLILGNTNDVGGYSLDNHHWLNCQNAQSIFEFREYVGFDVNHFFRLFLFYVL